MLNDAFPSLLSSRWNVSPLEHLARALGTPRRGGGTPPLRAWADDKGLVLELLLPGVARDGLELDVEGQTLTLRAERSHFEAGEDTPRTSTLERRLGLPYAVDQEHARARLEEGVLRLELPRASRSRRIHLEGTEAPNPLAPNSEVGLEERKEIEHSPDGGEELPRRGARVRARQAEDAYRVAIDAPGVRGEDISLTIEGDELQVTGTPRWTAPEGMRLTHADHAPAAWTAALHVPEDVDPEAIHAAVADGVVQLTLPRRPVRRRRIEVQGS